MALAASAAGQPVLLGAAGIAALAFNAVRAARPAVMLAVAFLGAQYAWPAPGGAALVGLAPLYAAGFVILVELATSSVDLAQLGGLPADLVAWRLQRTGLLAVAAILLSVLILAVATVPLRSAALRAAGVGVAAALWTALVVLARRTLRHH